MNGFFNLIFYIIMKKNIIMTVKKIIKRHLSITIPNIITKENNNIYFKNIVFYYTKIVEFFIKFKYLILFFIIIILYLKR